MAVKAQMPDFDLYFANNLTEVTRFEEIKNPNSGLKWTKVKTVEGDMSGNFIEVENVKKMLGSTRKKWLADKRMFWTMRDHTLLCFRIENKKDDSDNFEVTLNNGKGEELSLVTDDYFFANLPLQEEPYEIKVTRIGHPKQYYKFRYFINGWDNESLYIFQLDQKRQATGKNYKLECITGNLDEQGEMHTNTTLLELEAKSFQSFYVPKGQDLVDLFLIDDGKKLRIDKRKLHPGIDMNNTYEYMDLTDEFHLDKHENREMMNFNWMGSGLYEKYDTLFLTLWNEKSRQLPSATIHVESVDADGKPNSAVATKYLGYDAKQKTHKILTMGKPAYIEVISRGYLPMVYQYKGPVDPETGIVSQARCAVDLTLRKGTVTNQKLTISEQRFLNLNDEKTIIVRNGVDHTLCTIDPVDLSLWVKTDTVNYLEDCGQNYPKLLNNKPIERYARLQVSFSRPKGSDLPESQLFCTDTESHKVYEAKNKNLRVIDARIYKTFSYDYYYVDFDLVGVIPQGSYCQLKLQSKDLSYTDFPVFCNYVLNRKTAKKEAEEEVNNKWLGCNDPNAVADASADCGWDFKLPITFKMSFKPIALKIAFTYDIRKGISNMLINIQANRQAKPGEEDKISEARDEKRAYDTFNAFQTKDKKTSLQIIDNAKVGNDWLYKEIDDIFDISAKRIGVGWFGGAKLNFKKKLKNKVLQVSEVSGQIGWGAGMYWSNLADNEKFQKLKAILDKVEKYVSFTGCVEMSAQLDFGIKSFDPKITQSMSAQNMGYFVRFGSKASIGATLRFTTPELIAPLFQASAGLRLGGKAGLQAGLEGPFSKVAPDAGLCFTALIVGQAFANIKTLLFSWSGSTQFRLGNQFLIPNTNHNPFHKDFPYWLPKQNLQPLAQSYQKIQAPEPSEYGKAVADNVAIDANPHFLNDSTIVYNDLQSPADYNDDQVTLLQLNDHTTHKLSAQGSAATNHARSKRANHEIIVYEQMNSSFNNSQVNAKNAVRLSVAMPSHIQAKLRTANGQWTYTNITQPATDGTTDMKPVVTIQEDGHAACIYRHGQLRPINENVAIDSIDNIQFVGQLMLKTFDGTQWSQPTPLFSQLDHQHTINQYDLFMRNDTVLVAASIKTDPTATSTLRYASKALDSPEVHYTDDELSPNSFMMQRVGKHAVIAIVYQTKDTMPDIYIRTLSMNGQADRQRSASLNTGHKMPSKVKIICDRNAQDIDDFAILWTELDNVFRGDDGKNTYTDNICHLLNASRIHISNSLYLTDPITLGGERDDDLVMTDFDGYLDDAHVSAVYTLGNPKTGAAVIMTNNKCFRNSCETLVSYGDPSLIQGGSLPVNVYVENTGSSPIIAVQAVINGQTFDIENAYVAPAKERTFTVLYPTGENFDGYISSSVNVQYNNIFKTKAHPRHKALNYLRQSYQSQRTRITSADVECNIVNRSIEDGVNTFVVELIDHASLASDMAVRVGVYGHPSSMEPLTDEAEVVVSASDFIQQGNVRKAYATINIAGITEPIEAYVNCYVVDLNNNSEDNSVAVVDNLHGIYNAALVNLFPTDNPVAIHRPDIDQALTSHRIQLAVSEEGIHVSNLHPDETVRIISTDGFTIGKKKSTTSSLFFPLTHHGIYLLTSDEETFKFKF
jgi:hypothetical protein